MPNKAYVSALMSGLLSSGLFLVVFGAGLGFIFMFVPALPLFFLGLSRRSPTLHIAVVSAALIITLIAGPAPGILFLLLLGIPAWYFSRKALLCSTHVSEEGPIWYPVGIIIMNMAVYACCLVALMIWYYSDLPGGLPQLLAQNIHDAFSELEGDYGDIIDRMANGWSFLMFPMTIWLWGMLLYAHAWIAEQGLLKNKKQVRPDMAVRDFPIPGWMLSLLAIAALASLIGSPSMSFLGKATLLSLMLPYFFLGCTIMHRSCAAWPNARFFLFFVYFLVFTQFWPVLILAGIGLWRQIKYLSAGSSWSKS